MFNPTDYAKYRKEYYSIWPTMGRVLLIVVLINLLYIMFHIAIHQNTTVEAQVREIQCVGVK